MKTKIWPSTVIGKVAAVFALIFIVLIVLKMSGRMPLPTFSIAALGIIGLLAGAVAVFKYKDRSVLAILSFVVGLIIILWTSAELAFPH